MPDLKVEDKFKLTLLQIEKRFVDLEVGLGELKDKLKDVNPEQLSSLNQRMDDIEDLTMVENAAVIELKKMLEGISQKFGSIPSAAEEIPKLNQRLDSLEKEISEVSEKPATIEVEERVKKLENQITTLQVNPPQAPPQMEEMQKRVQDLSQRLTNLKMEYEDAVKIIETRTKDALNQVNGMPVADINFIDSKLQSLKTAIDMLSDKKVETDLKLAGIEEKILLLDQKIKESLSQKFVDEIKSHKRDLMATGIRIESVERVIKELNGELQEVTKNIRKFDDFEKLTLLNKQVEDKLERFKFIEDQTSRLSSKIEAIYDQMNKDFSGFKNSERRIDGVVQTVNNMIKDLEKTKANTNQVARRAELQDFNKKFDSKYNELEKKVREILNKPSDEINEKPVIDLRNSLNQSMITLRDVEDKVNRLNREVPAIFVEKSEIKNVVYGMRDRVNSLDSRLREINQVLGNLKPEAVQKIDGSLIKIEDISKRISSVETKLEEMKITTPDIADMIPQGAYVDDQISELLGKLVFLESRISAVERSVTEKPQMQPIILE
jgi:chromosome segregation ATPase